MLPLHWAIIHRDFETTKYLLGTNVNKASSDGMNCLMHAVRAVSKTNSEKINNSIFDFHELFYLLRK